MSCARALFALGVALLQSSCASLAATFEHKNLPENKIYLGVRSDIEMLAGGRAGFPEGRLPELFWAFSIVDLPFSFVCDTILLPYTVPYTLFRASE